MAYSLKQAAVASGKSKPTILRAIQSGKISAEKDKDGEWQIATLSSGVLNEGYCWYGIQRSLEIVLLPTW